MDFFHSHCALGHFLQPKGETKQTNQLSFVVYEKQICSCKTHLRDLNMVSLELIWAEKDSSRDLLP